MKLAGRFLPDDFLIPWVASYHSGHGLAGEGIDAKELVRYVKARVSHVQIDDFENEGLSSRYWLVFTK